MTTSTQWYLDSIERELADLPADERAELLEDLAVHFSEFETDDDLVSSLGDPVTYARELRDAAGLSTTPALDMHVAFVDRVRANFDAMRRSAWWRAFAAFLPELRPAWWVLRAWLFVVAIAEAPTDAGGLDFPFPRVADNALVGLAALMVVVPVSVMLGLQARRGQRKGLNVALTVFGVLFFVVVPASANDEPRRTILGSAVGSTVPGPSTVAYLGAATSPGIWVYDNAGNAYRVLRIYSTPNGQTELHALCPSGVISSSNPAQRSVDGDPIVCAGELPRGVSASTTPSTTLTTTTTAPSSTTMPASTITIVPTTIITEGTR